MLPEPFLSCTMAFLFVVIPINFDCQAQHFYFLHSSLSSFSLSSLCPILRSFLFHFTYVHINLFFISPIFFFCAVIAFHCPCHLVDLYLFIVICIVSFIRRRRLEFDLNVSCHFESHVKRRF